MIIGIDLDNTIIQYDTLIYHLAREKDLIPEGFKKNKKEIRDYIRRTLPEGEIEWQIIQGAIYGGLIHRAEPFDGVRDFLKGCLRERCKVFIISHKTRYANYDKTQTDLREAALNWIGEKLDFSKSGGLIAMNAVRFGSTRQEKVNEIIHLKCDWFIDDLLETFLEPGFPLETRKILFGSDLETPPGDIKVCATWDEIGRSIFSK